MTDAFFDTNVLLYLLSADDPKADIATEVLGRGGVISVQVLNEFALVARRKHAIDWGELEMLLEGFRTILAVESLTSESQARAMQIARRYQLRIYDANILAAAEQAGCSILYSEDMQDGQVIGGLTIRNPFTDA